MADTTTPTWRLGHGHVTPRPDGVKARCGGPAICKVCQAEQAALASPAPQELPPVQLPELPSRHWVEGEPRYPIYQACKRWMTTRPGEQAGVEADKIDDCIDALLQAYALAAIAADRRAGGR